jgi:hypothetical protein
MTTFDSREQAFENRYAHDDELKFNVAARRNKLLGLWAAEKLGLSGDAADAYAATVVIADLEEAGFEDVIRKLVADLAAAHVDEATIRAALVEKAGEARRQIMAKM